MVEPTEKPDGGSPHGEEKNSSVVPRVNPGVRTHGIGVWGNPRVVMGVRVDTELKKRFRRAARDLYGSICNPVEGFMVAVVEAHKGLPEGAGLTPGLTVSSRPEVRVEIGSMTIERRLRPRRMLDPSKVEVGEVARVREEERLARVDAGAEARRLVREEAVRGHEEGVAAWAAKVLGELPVGHVAQLGPVYVAMRAVEVPGPLQMDVKNAVVDELSRR